jgi:hypothetical protein
LYQQRRQEGGAAADFPLAIGSRRNFNVLTPKFRRRISRTGFAGEGGAAAKVSLAIRRISLPQFHFELGKLTLPKLIF